MDGFGGYYAKGNASEKDKYCMISLICGIEKIPQTREYNKKRNKLLDTENKHVVTSRKREGGMGKIGVGD